MSDTTTDVIEAEDTATPSTGDSTEAEGASENDAPQGDVDALGDAGKKALDAMKADRNKYRDELKGLRAELDALKAAAEGREAEHTAAVEAQKAKDEAIASANLKIAKANLRAAAAGKLADPMDALTFIDASSFEVDDDGNIDEDALASAIDDLIRSKPYLAAQGKRFQGDADGGTRKEARPAQLTRDDLSRMSPEEINTARAEGRLNDLLGVTT
jgi:hypothetical protein